MDPNTFHLHDIHVSYALSYLCGSAQHHFDTQLEDKDEAGFTPPNWLHDWTRFIEEVRNMFGDPNMEAMAEAELDGLHMRTNKKFADFLVEFNTLSSQANWGDCALHHWLKQVLPDCIKDSLALIEELVIFNDWKCLVQNIDQWYWERQADICRDAQPNPGTVTNQGNPLSNAHNTTSGPPPTPATTSMWDSNNTSSVTCHLMAQGGLTQTKQDQWIAQGLCLYCGGQGHKASECSKVWKAWETSGRAVQSWEAVVTPLGSSTMPVEPKITVILEN
jgi:hypothetical protein